jgi:hypothetical protein
LANIKNGIPMKRIFILILYTSFIQLNAQNIEFFEDETEGTNSFTNNGQSFTIESSINENFTIKKIVEFGWNGSIRDDKYIDNVDNSNSNDGCSFTIKTTDGLDITIKSLYLFVGSSDETLITNETITIIGKKDNNIIYTINKTSGFETLTAPTNGYTFIDFSSEGTIDNSEKSVDELIISSTSSADYLALDTLSWNNETLSTSDFQINKKIKLYPNPTTTYFKVSGLNATENYRIYNILGIEVLSGTISNYEKIEIEKLSKGVYFIKFNNGGKINLIKK